VWKAIKEFLVQAADYVADAATSKSLFHKTFEPALKQFSEVLHEQTTELLRPHQKSYPITYNNYFTEDLQRLRIERNKNEYSKIIKQFFSMASLDVPHYCGGQRDLNQLVNALTFHTEPDMNRFACSEALDCMEAYYKVGSSHFICASLLANPIV
jgi:hypothetical protein